MDPVNKWLTVIVLFMIALLITIGWKAGSGRYEFVVTGSTPYDKHVVVHVLDTKDGDVYSKIVDEKDLRIGSKVNARATKTFEIPSSRYGVSSSRY